MPDLSAVFSPETIDRLFPAERTDQFFDALFGDPQEGAYNIRLRFNGGNTDRLNFLFELHEKPGKCLACNLTYGLPEVFSRHPVINIKGLMTEINALLGGNVRCADWKLGTTNAVSKQLYTIPLIITLDGLKSA